MSRSQDSKLFAQIDSWILDYLVEHQCFHVKNKSKRLRSLNKAAQQLSRIRAKCDEYDALSMFIQRFTELILSKKTSKKTNKHLDGSHDDDDDEDDDNGDNDDKLLERMVQVCREYKLNLGSEFSLIGRCLQRSWITASQKEELISGIMTVIEDIRKSLGKPLIIKIGEKAMQNKLFEFNILRSLNICNGAVEAKEKERDGEKEKERDGEKEKEKGGEKERCGGDDDSNHSMLGLENNKCIEVNSVSRLINKIISSDDDDDEVMSINSLIIDEIEGDDECRDNLGGCCSENVVVSQSSESTVDGNNTIGDIVNGKNNNGENDNKNDDNKFNDKENDKDDDNNKFNDKDDDNNKFNDKDDKRKADEIDEAVFESGSSADDYGGLIIRHINGDTVKNRVDENNSDNRTKLAPNPSPVKQQIRKPKPNNIIGEENSPIKVAKTTKPSTKKISQKEILSKKEAENKTTSSNSKPPPSSSSHLKPPPSSSHLKPPPSSSSHLKPPPSSSHLKPPPSSSHPKPPPPSSSSNLKPPSSSSHLKPPSSSSHLKPPPSSSHLKPSSSHLKPPPPSSSSHLKPPPSSHLKPPPSSPLKPPPLSSSHLKPPPSSNHKPAPSHHKPSSSHHKPSSSYHKPSSSHQKSSSSHHKLVSPPQNKPSSTTHTPNKMKSKRPKESFQKKTETKMNEVSDIEFSDSSLESIEIGKKKNYAKNYHHKTAKKGWTADEEMELVRLVDGMGAGNWADMVNTGMLPGRSNVNLKDKWRTLLQTGRLLELRGLVRKRRGDDDDDDDDDD